MILITGGTGQLGAAFRALLPDALAPGRAMLDLTRPDELEAAVARLQPTAIINCAAYTAVDRAESEQETALLVNGVSVGVLAGIAAARGIPFVTFSTDYVFDGTATAPYLESAVTNPINTYGRSKLAGEHAAREANPEALVVRTSWVYSSTHRNFVSIVLGRAREGGVRVVADQFGCPTYAPDLADATMRAMERGATGILHITNAGPTTWYEFARAACGAAGLSPDLVTPIAASEYPTAARRPHYSVLASERRRSLGLADLRPWDETLHEVVAAAPPR
jgi:dTDP-4-dehydrorhamnose reductase